MATLNETEQSLLVRQKEARNALVKSWNAENPGKYSVGDQGLGDMFYQNQQGAIVPSTKMILQKAIQHDRPDIIQKMLYNKETYGGLSFKEKDTLIQLFSNQMAMEAYPKKQRSYHSAILSLKQDQMQTLHHAKNQAKADIEQAQKLAPAVVQAKEAALAAKHQSDLEFGPKREKNPSEIKALLEETKAAGELVKTTEQDHQNLKTQVDTAKQKYQSASKAIDHYNQKYDKLEQQTHKLQSLMNAPKNPAMPDPYQYIEKQYKDSLPIFKDFPKNLGNLAYKLGISTPPQKEVVKFAMGQDSNFFDKMTKAVLGGDPKQETKPSAESAALASRMTHATVDANQSSVSLASENSSKDMTVQANTAAQNAQAQTLAANAKPNPNLASTQPTSPTAEQEHKGGVRKR